MYVVPIRFSLPHTFAVLGKMATNGFIFSEKKFRDASAEECKILSVGFSLHTIVMGV